MEQLPALIPVLCIFLLLPTWAAAVAEIPAGCRRLIPNGDVSARKPDALSVSQQPQSLKATAGENVTLSCTFPNTDSSRAQVLWLWGSGDDMQLDSHHPFYWRRLQVSTLDEHRQGKATLSLAELEQRDSGLYRCCIQIGNERTGLGGGTELRVMRRKQSEAEGCELCADLRTLYSRAVVSLSLAVLFSLGIILSLQPRSSASSMRDPLSLPVPNSCMESLCGLISSPCSTPEPAASQHRAMAPRVSSLCPTPP